MTEPVRVMGKGIPGVIRRINVDTLDRLSELRKQGLEDWQVVTENNSVVRLAVCTVQIVQAVVNIQLGVAIRVAWIFLKNWQWRGERACHAYSVCISSVYSMNIADTDTNRKPQNGAKWRRWAGLGDGPSGSHVLCGNPFHDALRTGRGASSKEVVVKLSRAPEDIGARGRETGVYAGYMRILSRRATPVFQAQ